MAYENVYKQPFCVKITFLHLLVFLRRGVPDILEIVHGLHCESERNLLCMYEALKAANLCVIVKYLEEYEYTNVYFQEDIFIIPVLCCPLQKNQNLISLDKICFRILTKLLEVSDDPQVLAVAAHDVGEYVRHYPRGKR